MNIRERIENNLIVFFLSTLLTGFLAGIATYEGILNIAQIHKISEAQYLEYQQLKETQPSSQKNQKKEEAILLVSGHKTIIHQFNIAVKLSAIDNYEPKNRTVFIHFYYPKSPAERITEQNMNDDENVISYFGSSLEADVEKQIAFGEVGVFTVSIHNLRFNNKHNFVQSLDFVIKERSR